MKIHHLVISLIIITLIGLTQSLYGQKCHEFHKSKKCNAVNVDNFKLSSLSRSHYLEVGKTITYELVIYGNKEIIIQCCTEDEYYPLRFKLKSSINGDLLYDNKYDNYTNTIRLELDQTELISIEITTVLNDGNISVLKDTKTCVGIAIYMEKPTVGQ